MRVLGAPRRADGLAGGGPRCGKLAALHAPTYHGDVARQQHRQHPVLPDPPCDQLRVLRAVIQHQAHRVVGEDIGALSFGLLCDMAVFGHDCHHNNPGAAMAWMKQ